MEVNKKKRCGANRFLFPSQSSRDKGGLETLHISNCGEKIIYILVHKRCAVQLETKHCDICSKDVLKSSYKNHLQSQKHKKNEFNPG